jgi:short-subunit dehydrogenase
MWRELAGKRAILTGATGGIGRATAAELVRAGVRLVVAARTADRLDELAASLGKGGEVVPVPTDVTCPEDRRRLIDATVQTLGGLDLLVNNSGVGSFGHFITSTEAVLRTVMEVNFFAPVELTRLAVPHLTEGNKPAVVNVTSMTGRRGMPAWPEYSASKFALVGMSEALRGEFARFDIDVLTIVPGLTNSGFDKHMLRRDGKMNIPFGSGMAPDYVAAGIVDAIVRNRRETVLGTEAKRILRMNRFFPRLLNRLIARRVRKLYSATPS